ncbi:hypothetical protein MTR67_007813 [Solanum verrucosum]|uniref:Uncharacterized protein n=1 Tax=Solanum verrucosum TaxID=315347 RepID=A0AAF0Q0R1_SOLVR|nr:hypothetical protein MTR67_007813 [Solanum verrucosum]
MVADTLSRRTSSMGSLVTINIDERLLARDVQRSDWTKEIALVKVQWKHRSVGNATRETENDMHCRYSNFSRL